MTFEHSKLRGRIIEMYGSQLKFAEILGVSEVSVSRKMTGGTSFSNEDIRQWCELLCICQSDIGTYFFT